MKPIIENPIRSLSCFVFKKIKRVKFNFFLSFDTQEAGYSWSSAAMVTIMENSLQSAKVPQQDMKEVNLTLCEEFSNKTMPPDVNGLIAYQGRVRFLKSGDRKGGVSDGYQGKIRLLKMGGGMVEGCQVLVVS